MGWTLGRNHTIDSLGSPTCRLTLQILGLVTLHNCMSQFLIINLFIYLSTYLSIYILLLLFLWRALILILILKVVLEEQNFKDEFLNWFWGFWNWLSNLIRF